MPSLLQINTVVNSGSTGRITEHLGICVTQNGWSSYIAYGRNNGSSHSELIKIGSDFDKIMHGIQTRLFDRHGLGSYSATKEIIKIIKEVNPDIIHLHNLHGYYLNIKLLFNYLSSLQTPVVWTLHDCWPFTGHCVYFDYVGCEKWETSCHKCPQKGTYPASLLLDRSKRNYFLKKKLFNSVHNLTIVAVSNWIQNLIVQSFLSSHGIQVINNGVDLSLFKPLATLDLKRKMGVENKFIVLGIANGWIQRKGLPDIYKLHHLLDKNFQIVLVGLTNNQMKHLPTGIIGIKRMDSISKLVEIYNIADVFINPTWEDNFPTTNLEALACGTPIITYNTGGSPETVTEETGYVIEQGDIGELLAAIKKVKSLGKNHFSNACRERAAKFYDKIERYNDYLRLYDSLLTKSRYS